MKGVAPGGTEAIMNRVQIDKDLATAKRIAPFLTDAMSVRALNLYIAELNGRRLIAGRVLRH